MNRPGKIAVAAWLAGITACLAIIAQTSFSANLSAFLPRSPSPAERILVDQLRDGVVSRVMLLGIENAPNPVLADLSKRLTDAVYKSKQFASVNNGQNTRIKADQDFLWRNRYLLSSGVEPQRFSEDNLRRSLAADLDLLNSDAGRLIKPYLPGDPTGEMLHLSGTARTIAQPEKRSGVWFSADGRRALIVARTADQASDIDAQKANSALVHRAFADAQRDTPGSSKARLIATGPVTFSVDIHDRIKGDATRFSAIATLLVAAILLLVYRSATMLIYGLLPVISGALAGVAAVSLAFGEVHGITLGFGVTLIGEAVDYPIYLFTQTVPGASPKDTLPRIWSTLRLGVLTSISGFGALLFSSFTGLAQLGAFSIAGLVVAVCVTRWVVPVLLPRGFAARRPMKIGAILRKLIQSAPALRLPALVLAIASLSFLVFHHGNLWNDDLAGLSPISVQDKRSDQTLRNELGAPDAGYLIVVSRPGLEETLRTSELVATGLRRLVDRHALAGFDSPATYLPSKATQERRQAAIPPPAELAARMAKALDTTPFQPDTFAPFLAQVAAARTGPLLDLASLKGTSLEQIVDSLLVKRDGMWQSMLPLHGVTRPQDIAGEITGMGISGVVFLDIKNASNTLYGTYRRESVALSLCGGLIIILLLFASLRRPIRVTRVLAPLAGAIVMTMAVLIAAGQRLTVFHLIGLLLVVAVGSNYSLFFERKSNPGEVREWVIASLVLANLCTVTGFGVLSLSSIPVLHGIGITVALGTFFSLVFSAIFSRNRHEATAP